MPEDRLSKKIHVLVLVGSHDEYIIFSDLRNFGLNWNMIIRRSSALVRQKWNKSRIMMMTMMIMMICEKGSNTL